MSIPLLTGYEEPPAELAAEAARGQELQSLLRQRATGSACRAPLTDDQVTYDDGTPATVDQMARTCRPSWPGRPSPRWKSARALGFMVMIYLAVLALLLYLVKKRIWANEH